MNETRALGREECMFVGRREYEGAGSSGFPGDTVEGKRMLLQVSLVKVKAINLYLAVGVSSVLGISEDSDYT